MTPEEHRLETAAAPDRVLKAVARAAEEWGAAWNPGPGGGRLDLPVMAGIRRGVVSGSVEAGASAGGSRLTLRVESSVYRVHRQALVILILGALGALPVILWPLSDRMLALAPVGLVLTFLAWFLVASRLRNAGPGQFLETVRNLLEDDPSRRDAAGGAIRPS